MQTLCIEWKRLVDAAGNTCPRCRDTGRAIDSAFLKLAKSLKPLGIRVTIRKRKISPSAFSKNPTYSNEIRIQGKPLENWLNAETGTSPCCDACGDAECRTTVVDGAAYEAIPENMILRAGLLAAVSLLAETTRLGEKTKKRAKTAKPEK